MSEFTHLHLHTHYSFTDAMIRIPELMQAVKAHGQTAVAVSEHGNLSSALQFYLQAKEHGVKPIIGCEAYVAQGSRLDRNVNLRRYYHLVLLAENEIGYRNLVRLASLAHLEGFYYRPRVDREILEKYNEGLICLSACLSGEIAVNILDNRMKEAMEVADWHRQVFKDRYYLEMQKNQLPDQDKVNAGVLEIAKKMKLPLVATNDVHYLLPEDAKAHDVLICIGTRATVSEKDRKRYGSEAFYLRSSKEMADLFYSTPEAVRNTMAIAERCNLEIHYGDFVYPRYEVSEGKTLDGVFEEMTRGGFACRLEELQRRFPDPAVFAKKKEEYEQRLQYEITLIKDKGFAAYLLIVQDVMNWARSQKIPVGPGRGSAAGSLVCYSLGITDIDPIRYKLLFERFLNPDRKDNPDIDCDFCAVGRERVIEHVTNKYGRDNVCQIATFGTMKAKAAVHDVGRALGFPHNDVNKMAKMIPNDLKMTLDLAVETNPELKKLIEDNAWAAELLHFARAVEGLNRQVGKHAAGIVIAPRPLTEYLPLQKDKDGLVITQWDKNDVEKYGLIKFDFLGLKTLTVIDKAIAMIERNHGLKIDIRNIPLDDKETFQLLAAGHTSGIFQLESGGMKDLVIRLRPSCIDEITALVALYRPGPMVMIEDYIANKHSGKALVYDLPALKEILDETYGMMVYQEQVMKVATDVGGLSMGAADTLRKLMSKKKPFDKYRATFMEGANAKGIPNKTAENIWAKMEKFGEYGFNKSHSAAYAYVSYQTAYLKTHYPLEYLAAMLTLESDNSEKLRVKVSDVREMGYEILPPDVNSSEHDFSVESGAIRFGLTGVRNLGEGASIGIVESRRRAARFAGLNHFLEEIANLRLNRRSLECLIGAGGFDSINPDRARLHAGVELSIERVNRIQREKDSRQETLFGGIGGAESGPASDDFLPAAEPWTEKEKLAQEKTALGFYLTGHPLRQYIKLIKKYTTHTCESIKKLKEPMDASVAVLIAGRKMKNTKRGRMAIFEVEDLSGSFEAVIYSETYEKYAELLRSDEPLMMVGRAEADEKRARLVVSKVFELSQAQRVVGSEMHVRLAHSGVALSAIEVLRGIFEKAGGGRCRPVIHVPVPGVGEALIKLPAEFNLEPSDEVVNQIETLLGRDVVNFS